MARVFRFGRLAYLRHVLIPNSLPSIVTGLRLSMGIAWMVIVAVEMLSGGVGIGFFVWNAYNALNLAHVICRHRAHRRGRAWCSTCCSCDWPVPSPIEEAQP